MTRFEVFKIVEDARKKGIRADLRYANLIRANLAEANLTRSNLSDADLARSNLSDADLRWANMPRANLSDANLTRSNLSDADLTEADLRWACLCGSILPHRYIQIGPIGSRKDQIVYNADIDEIQAGCFRGSLEEFEEAVRKKHDTNIHAREYLATVRYLQEMREIQKQEVVK